MQLVCPFLTHHSAPFCPGRGFLALIAAATSVAWSTRTSSTLLMAFVPQIDDMKYMMAYVCALMFSAFSLLVLF